MVFKNFAINIIVRVILLSLTMFLFFYLVFKTEYIATLVLIAAIIIYQIWSLVFYVNKTNRYLVSFLEAINYSEFSRSFRVEGLGVAFDELKVAFNAVIKNFQNLRNEKEEQYMFLQNVMQHIEISMIAYHPDGTIELFNNATKKLFRRNNLRNISDLSNVSEDLVKVFSTIKSGNKKLVKINDDNDLLQLSIYAKEFKLNDQLLTLVSIQNIQPELDDKEMDSWQKLISVLTHEIMNSITPIASLSSTVNSMIGQVKSDEILELPPSVQETIDDIQNALETINKRSTGLLHFVETYRSLTRLPKPNFSIFKVQSMFDDIERLMKEEMKSDNINITFSIQPDKLEMTADMELLEQVMINLIKNSAHALEGKANPKIDVSAKLNERGNIILQVTDNGQGILPDVIDKVFIPFFTTKTKGSGIGLSLSRQILRLHGGTITVHSIPEKETTFTLKF